MQYGLNAGRFYISFNKDAAQPVEDKEVWSTYVKKRDADYAEITEHLDGLGTLRTYRIVGNIKLLANEIEQRAAPKLRDAYRRWRKRVVLSDLALGVLIGTLIGWLWLKTGLLLASMESDCGRCGAWRRHGGLASFDAPYYRVSHCGDTWRRRSLVICAPLFARAQAGGGL